MSSSLRLQVLTPVETLLRAEAVHWVHVRLADGAGITIYPRHAPLLAETVSGALRYADASGEHTFDAQEGILHVEGERVTVFTSGQAGTGEARKPSTVPQETQFERLAQELRTRLAGEGRDILEINGGPR